MRRLVCIEGGSSKFWEGSVEGNTFTVRFGKLGTEGQVKTKIFASADAAEAELAKVAGEKLRKGYVEDGATAASNAGKPAAPRKAPVFMRTFATYPRDWNEGANDGHPFEVRFAAVPDAAAMVEIARTFEAAIKQGVATSASRAWQWSGQWALFFAGEGKGEDVDARAAISAVEKAFGAVHAIAPVEWFIFLGARALELDPGDDGPPSGPDWPGHGFDDDIYGRGARFDPEESAGPDGPFEQARAEAAGRAFVEPAKTSGKRKPDHPFELRASSLKADVVPPKIVARFGKKDDVGGCRIIAGRTFATSKGKLQFLDGDTIRTIELPESVYSAFDVHPGGERGLAVMFVGNDLYEFELPSGKARKLEVPCPVGDIRYVAGGKLLVGSGSALTLLSPDLKNQLAQLSFHVHRDGLICNMVPVLGGTAVVLARRASEKLLCVVAIGDDCLVEIGRTSAIRVKTAFEKEGRVIVSGQEIVNLRELVATALQ